TTCRGGAAPPSPAPAPAGPRSPPGYVRAESPPTRFPNRPPPLSAAINAAAHPADAPPPRHSDPDHFPAGTATAARHHAAPWLVSSPAAAPAPPAEPPLSPVAQHPAAFPAPAATAGALP